MIKLLGLALLAFSSVTLATDIQLTWLTPELREDGTNIQEIEKYNLYHSVNNVLQDVIEISSSDTSFDALNLLPGNHSYQITAIESGIESDKSNSVSKYAPDKDPSKTIQILLTIEVK